MTAHKLTARDRLIVALDVDSAAAAGELVKLTASAVGVFKIGLQLFVKEGPDLVRWLVDQGVGVFLDLKLHDIPNTILAAARQIAGLGVRYFTVHCSNGQQALAACQAGLAEFCAEQGLTPPTMLGVTVLTSLSDVDLHGIGMLGDPRSQVELLAGQAYRAGLRGLVASAQEAAALRALFPDVFIVTPGIRPSGSGRDDQARIMTPAAAIHAGADALVIGRPVTRAGDPARAAAGILSEIEGALAASK
ncbi:MAG: orotidine-5'-phosphate decarboxylase [Acidobacteria bacterium]|nr:orotidine-5'-phosphate decarboxylase [Acidobacteriota bacterium]